MTNPCSFVSTYLGMSLSSAWICGLGAAVVSVFPGVDIVVGLKMAGDQVVAGYGGSAVYLAVALGGIVVTGMSLYGSALTTMTGIESLSTIKMTQRVRVILTVGMSVACIPICFIFTNNFQTSLTVFYALLMYALAPWTAINLVDFFFVRKGHYSIREIFNPDGIYGMWNWRGYTAYIISALPMHVDFAENYHVEGTFEENMVVCVESLIGDEGGDECVKLETQVVIEAAGARRIDRFPFENFDDA